MKIYLWEHTKSEGSISMALDSKKLQLFRQHLPYGKWITSNKREILFNRDYTPLWERTNADGRYLVSQANSSEKVTGIVDETWYYDDGSTPWDDKNVLQICINALTDFGATVDASLNKYV